MISAIERKAQLVARLGDLKARLDRIGKELSEPQSKDWEDMATEQEGEEVLIGMGEAGEHEIRQIEAALGRIEAGEYGFCARCGTAIAEARLDLLPWTPLCRDCAAEAG